MGISLGSFQIVGGLFLLIISYEMVLEKRLKRKGDLIRERTIQRWQLVIHQTQKFDISCFEELTLFLL